MLKDRERKKNRTQIDGEKKFCRTDIILLNIQ